MDTDDVGQAHPRRPAEHDVLGLETTDADRDHAQRVDVRGVAVGADQRIGKRDTVLGVDDRRHPLQVDLVHDAVARRDHVDVLERLLGPVDEVKAILVAAIFDRAVFRERVFVEPAVLDGQGMVDDQLHRHDGIDLRRIATLLRDGITQSREVDQRGLAENVVTHDARRKPGEVQVAPAFDQLCQRCIQRRWIAAAHEVLGEHSRGVWQAVVRARLDRVDRGPCVEIVETRAGQGLAVVGVHGRCSIGTNFWSSGPM